MEKLIRIAIVLFFLATTNYSMAQKLTIYYVFDPLCGWCYGFTPVMIDFKEKHKDKFDFKIISGGMVVGLRVHPITHMSSYISQAHKRVEDLTGVTFGEEFLNKTLYDSTVIMDSELPTRALLVFMKMKPDHAFEFAHDIQKALYYDGQNLSEKSTYGPLAAKYGIDSEYFINELRQEEYRQQAYEQFEQSNQLGVTGFPSVVLEHNSRKQKITSGYVSLEKLETQVGLVEDLQ